MSIREKHVRLMVSNGVGFVDGPIVPLSYLVGRKPEPAIESQGKMINIIDMKGGECVGEGSIPLHHLTGIIPKTVRDTPKRKRSICH